MMFGEKVARILSEQQRTQRWLAREVRTSPNTISKVVKGGDTSYRTAYKVARVLGVDANWLLNDDLDWPPQLHPMTILPAPGVRDIGNLMFQQINKIYDLFFPFAAGHNRNGGTFPDKPRSPRSRSRAGPKPRSTGEKTTEAKPKKPQPRTTGKRSAPAKPRRPKRPPRS